jgi:hypothetical protein
MSTALNFDSYFLQIPGMILTATKLAINNIPAVTTPTPTTPTTAATAATTATATAAAATAAADDNKNNNKATTV